MFQVLNLQSALVVLAETGKLKPEEMTAATVSPGLPGFIIFFLLCCAVAFLGWDLSRRIRRSTARENVRLRMEAAEKAAAEKTVAEKKLSEQD